MNLEYEPPTWAKRAAEEILSEDHYPDDTIFGVAAVIDKYALKSELVVGYLTLFASAIEHGDEQHRQWLRDAVKSFIDKGTIPARPCPCSDISPK